MRKPAKRLLIIDENPHIISVLQQTLKTEFDCVVARSGRDAVRLLMQGNRFDAIMTELNLTAFSGLELIRFVRANQLIGQTPIIVLSSATDSATRIDCLDAGADSYLPKPFNPLEARAKIQSLLRRTAALPEVYQLPVTSQKASRQKVSWSLNTLFNLF
ncbi:response regulator transcription factor [Fibrella aquatilis]|uniref:Response regulator transcription factor n=1 Tax=Fibrella aquatilis TaxID=2817059 RepID=A0A939G7W0_9BACT|nr:response regulator transcription factor [Fibrella aquatilis]MBO0932630.1 response regulator transcription factor [Fibrella aquatilis]